MRKSHGEQNGRTQLLYLTCWFKTRPTAVRRWTSFVRAWGWSRHGGKHRAVSGTWSTFTDACNSRRHRKLTCVISSYSMDKVQLVVRIFLQNHSCERHVSFKIWRGPLFHLSNSWFPLQKRGSQVICIKICV